MTASLDSRIAAPATRIHHATGPRAETVGAFILDTPLQRAIRSLNDHGIDVPCINRWDLFTADDRASRLMAELMCASCPILAECGAEADSRGERFGVYGGRDRTPRYDGRPA